MSYVKVEAVLVRDGVETPIKLMVDVIEWTRWTENGVQHTRGSCGTEHGDEIGHFRFSEPVVQASEPPKEKP